MRPDSLHYAGSVLWNSRLPQPPVTQNPFTSLLVRNPSCCSHAALRPMQRSRKCLPSSVHHGTFYSVFFGGTISPPLISEFDKCFNIFSPPASPLSQPLCEMCVFVFLAEATIGSICVAAWLWSSLCNWRFEHFSPDVPIPESWLIWET